MYVNSKVSKTLSREGHFGKKSCVSETVIEICRKKITLSREGHSGKKSFVSETVIEICRKKSQFFQTFCCCYGIFLSQQSQATVGLVITNENIR